MSLQETQDETRNTTQQPTSTPFPVLTKYKDIYIPSIYTIDFSSIKNAGWREPSAKQSDYFNYGYNEEQWIKHNELIKQKFDDLNEQVQKQNIKLPSVQDELNYLMNFPSDYGGLGDVFNDQYYENVNLFEKKCALQKLIPVERSGQMAVPLETPSNINITYRTNSNITNTTNSVPLNNYFPVSQGTFLYPTFPMNNQINLTSYAQMQMMYNRKQLLTGGNVASQGEKEGNGEGVQGAMNINRNVNDSVRNVGSKEDNVKEKKKKTERQRRKHSHSRSRSRSRSRNDSRSDSSSFSSTSSSHEYSKKNKNHHRHKHRSRNKSRSKRKHDKDKKKEKESKHHHKK